MRRVQKIMMPGFICGSVMIACLLLPPAALAADKSGSWMPIYNQVMRWINFAVLVFVLVKFAKAPLMNFLRDRKEQLAQEFEKALAERQKIFEQVKAAHQALDSSQERLTALKERIIKQAEAEKEKIIVGARRESRLMLDRANMRIENQIQQARERFRAELIDAAVDLALARLPAEITPGDQQKLVDRYIQEAF